MAVLGERVRRYLAALSFAALVSCSTVSSELDFVSMNLDGATAECWSRSADERESGDRAAVRRGMIETVTCFREEFLRQYRALVDRYVDFAAKEGVDPDVARRRNFAEYEQRVQEGSCYPSCSRIEMSDDLDSDARTGELLVRDLIVERNLYRVWPARARGGVFSHVRNHAQIIHECRAISDGMRSNRPAIAAWGLRRSIRCLEYAILDQVEALVDDNELLSRQHFRLFLDRLAELRDGLLAPIHRSSAVCAADDRCDSDVETRYLRDHFDLLAHVIKAVIDIRVRRRL